VKKGIGDPYNCGSKLHKSFTYQQGVPEVDECGLAEIGNLKEETRGTQFRLVRAAMCVIPYVFYAL
jgi:hypothetical protein